MNETYPLSYGQASLWIFEQLVGPSPTYSIPLVYDFHRPIDSTILRLALADLVRRHDVLRANICIERGMPRLAVVSDANVDVPLRLARIRGEPGARVDELTRREARSPFDFRDGGRLWRCLLIDHVDGARLVIVLHHMIFDSWSLSILNHELGCAFDARAEGKEPAFAPLNISYTDYAQWQRSVVWRDELREFWSRELQGAPVSDPEDTIDGGAPMSFQLDTVSPTQIRTASQTLGLTPFAFLYATFVLTLLDKRLNDDIVVGVPVSVRPNSECERLVGYFVNVVAARSVGALSQADPIRHVAAAAVRAVAHAALPLSEILRAARARPVRWHTPLVDTLFTYENAAPGQLEIGGQRAQARIEHTGTAKFGLNLAIIPADEAFNCVIEARATMSANLAAASVIERFPLIVAEAVGSARQGVA